jgi:hypothetical protein
MRTVVIAVIRVLNRAAEEQIERIQYMPLNYRHYFHVILKLGICLSFSQYKSKNMQSTGNGGEISQIRELLRYQ